MTRSVHVSCETRAPPVTSEVGPRLLAELVHDALGQVVDAQRVGEAAVLGAGVDEPGQAELADAAQALHGARVEQVEHEALVDAHDVVDRVADERRQRAHRH